MCFAVTQEEWRHSYIELLLYRSDTKAGIFLGYLQLGYQWLTQLICGENKRNIIWFLKILISN